MPNRPRAPTITVDTTAVGSSNPDAQIPMQTLSNPTSPQEATADPNLLNPNSAGNFLSVPSLSPSVSSTLGGDTFAGPGSRQSSDAGRSYFGGDATNDFLKPEDALRPDPGTEADFKVENNPFAFAPGHLGKLYNPKSLAAFSALGGAEGLEKGLRTNLRSGLNSSEQHLDGHISFEDATVTELSAKPKGVHE